MMNLQVVNDAFGAHADLYQDCLKVSPSATSREIQNAFLAQRRELLHKLERGHDFNKQMDAVVLAVRILGDAELRAQYDNVRKERMKRAPGRTQLHKSMIMKSSYISPYGVKENSGSLHGHEMHDSTIISADSEMHHYSSYSNSNQSTDVHRAATRRTRIVTPEPISRVDDALDTTEYTYDETLTVDQTLDQTLDQTIDELTLVSGESQIVPRSLLGRLTDECIGALEDTSKSLEEIFSVFTLQEDEIDAVVKRIDKAKRQMNMTV